MTDGGPIAVGVPVKRSSSLSLSLERERERVRAHPRAFVHAPIHFWGIDEIELRINIGCHVLTAAFTASFLLVRLCRVICWSTGVQKGGMKLNVGTADLHAKILEFRGFDSSIILSLRGGIVMFIGNSLE